MDPTRIDEIPLDTPTVNYTLTDADARWRVREAIALDIATAGKLLCHVRESLTDEVLLDLLPVPMQSVLLARLADARLALMKAMDCLTTEHSPTVEAIIQMLLARFRQQTEENQQRTIESLRFGIGLYKKGASRG